ncbi:MAG TPA: GTP cyclohydrolase II [Membranihabitans sp.]|nr:GTP cyclohydrolase II [Membranihabitans sp.]
MKKLSEAGIPTEYGNFQVIAFGESDEDYTPHLALVSDKADLSKPVLVRIHSECITGDTFGSRRCECGEQLASSLRRLGKEGGILIYLRQEGRGIGLVNKLRAYQLQDEGLDTVEANVHLGFDPDERHYDVAVDILEILNVHEIILMTNNPEKVEAIRDSSVKLVGREPLIVPTRDSNEAYMKTKENYFGHLLKHQ